MLGKTRLAVLCLGIEALRLKANVQAMAGCSVKKVEIQVTAGLWLIRILEYEVWSRESRERSGHHIGQCFLPEAALLQLPLGIE
jgi:hypothetical protein